VSTRSPETNQVPVVFAPESQGEVGLCRSQRSERKVHRGFGVCPGNGWVIDPTNEATPRSKLVEKTAI